MCELNAYIEKDGKEALYIESVETVRPEGEKIYLRNLFGEEKIFEGRIKEISFRRKKILLEPA